MTGRVLLGTVLLAVAAGAGYMAVMTWRAADDGKWLFTVFAVFFLGLAGAIFVPAKSAPPAKTTGISGGFAPHWALLGSTVIAVGAIIWAIVAAIRGP